MPKALTDLLLQRVSFPRLVAPVPSSDVLEKIFQSALRTPDHMQLKPWRYLVIEGQALVKLGELFCHAALKDKAELSQKEKEKYLNMPMRAPMIIVAISKHIEHEKVPYCEQLSSGSVGLGYMLLALQASGFGGIWRTGVMARHPYVMKGLSLFENETITGFLYLGTPNSASKKLQTINSSDYFQWWQ